jgi:NTP pyrophosphatase (non-canonical NTP hydrolase)
MVSQTYLEEIRREIARIAQLKGWIDSPPEKFVCALTELGEAGNAWKKNASQDTKAEELADVIISTLDLSRVLCPMVNMDDVVAHKLKRLEQTDDPGRSYIVIDVSAFLARKRLPFLLKLLEEKELSPSRVVLADKIHSILSRFVDHKEFSKQDLSLFLEIAQSWEGPYPNRIGKWLGSEEFLGLLQTFFQRWKPLPASEFIGYDRTKNPIDAEELKRKLGVAGDLLYDELKTAEKTRSCILCLSRGLAHLLTRARHFLIEIPHAKKKMWMVKHDYIGGFLFMIVTGVAATNITPVDLENLLSEIAQHASPIVRNLFADVDISILAHWICQLLSPTIAAGLGAVSVAIAFDSISYPKIVFKP